MADSLLWLEPKQYTLHKAAAADGDGELFRLGGRYGSMALQVSGTFVGKINFEATYDGVNYIALMGSNQNDGSNATNTTEPGAFAFSVIGVDKFRARISDYASGTISVVAIATAASLSGNQTAITKGTMNIAGETLVEQLTEADAVEGVLTFAEAIQCVEIYNTDEVNAGVFNVNGINITIPAGKIYKSFIDGEPSKEVTIVDAETYIVSRYV